MNDGSYANAYDDEDSKSITELEFLQRDSPFIKSLEE